MRSGNRDDKFSIYVPKDKGDASPEAPDYLEIVESGPGGKPKDRMQGGAYDPYQKQELGSPGGTAKIRRPRVDLRKLSEWIKTQQRVKELRAEEEEAQRRATQEKKGRFGPFKSK
jgi:hypothetical protein